MHRFSGQMNEGKRRKRVKAVIAVLLFMLSPVISFMSIELLNQGIWQEFTVLETLANLIWYYLFYLIVFSLLRRAWLTVVIGQTVGVVISLISYTLVEMRDIPLLPMHISLLGTVKNVADQYHFTIPLRVHLAAMAAIAWIVLCAAWMDQHKKLTLKRYLVGLTAGLLCGILGFIGFRFSDFKSVFEIGINYWDVKGYYQRHGFMLAFLTFAQNQYVEKPSGYSPEVVADILRPYRSDQQPTEKQPTIIGIMNESYADYEGFDGVTFNQTLTPFYRSLKGDNVIKGNIYVSIFGGGTVNSEYEFLTGNSLTFLPNQAIPFQQFLDKPAPSLATQLQDLGYQTVAMHPYYASGYSRQTAWKNLGFETLYFMDTHRPFDFSDRLRGLISDDANYREMLKIIREDRDQPLFLFDVTIQNHGDYEVADLPEIDTGLRVTNMASEYDRANVFFNLMQHSDQALQMFLTELEEEEEPIVVVLFGDHQPSLGEAFLDQMMGKDRPQTDAYQVPFLIWANFPLHKEGLPESINTSPNFLSSYLMHSISDRIRPSAFQNFQQRLMKEWPAMTILGSQNGQAEWITDPQASILSDYQQLVYDRVKGDWQQSTTFYESK